MVYTYLLDLYKELDRRKRKLEEELASAADDPEKYRFLQGRQAIVEDFSAFLVKNYHEKLPRRVQQRR